MTQKSPEKSVAKICPTVGRPTQNVGRPFPGHNENVAQMLPESHSNDAYKQVKVRKEPMSLDMPDTRGRRKLPDRRSTDEKIGRPFPAHNDNGAQMLPESHSSNVEHLGKVPNDQRFL